MSILKKFDNYYDSYTPNEKLISDYIKYHTNEVCEISIQEFAARLKISTASISRFAKKMGYTSHSHLKMELVRALTIENENEKADYLEPVSWSNSLEEIAHKLILSIADLQETALAINDFSTINKAVDMIRKSSHIYLYASGSSILAAKELNLRLLRLSKPALFIDDSNYGLQNLVDAGPSDIMFLISYSGESPTILPMIRMAQSQKMKIISITKFSQSKLADASNIALYCPTISNSDARLSSVLRKYSQIFLVDLLFIGLAKKLNKDPEKMIEYYIDHFFFKGKTE